MKLFQKKKKNNKGFSLVELIVVVAIMAVLLGVLVPTLVRNVEKSKHQKDINNLSEVRNAFEIEMASEKFAGLEGTLTYTGDKLVLMTPDTAVSGDWADFLDEVVQNLNGEGATDYTLEYTSKISASDTKVTFTFANEKVTGEVTSTKYGSEELQ